MRVESSVGREPSVQSVLIPGDGSYTLTKVGVCQGLQTSTSSCRGSCSPLQREARRESGPGELTASQGAELGLELGLLLGGSCQVGVIQL